MRWEMQSSASHTEMIFYFSYVSNIAQETLIVIFFDFPLYFEVPFAFTVIV